MRCLGMAFCPTFYGQPCRQSGRQLRDLLTQCAWPTSRLLGHQYAQSSMLQPSHQRRRTADRGRLALRASSSTSSKRRSANSVFKSTSASSASLPASSPTCSNARQRFQKSASRCRLAARTLAPSVKYALLCHAALFVASKRTQCDILLAGAYNRSARAAQLHTYTLLPRFTKLASCNTGSARSSACPEQFCLGKRDPPLT